MNPNSIPIRDEQIISWQDFAFLRLCPNSVFTPESSLVKEAACLKAQPASDTLNSKRI
jgi:hypothetical protein